MSRELKLTRGVLALILAGVVVVAAGAQTTPLPRFCTGGPFTLTGGEANFRLALDDNPTAPPMGVTMRLYDADGNIVARTNVQLAAGKTATLAFRGAGVYRAQATFDSLINPSDRRDTAGAVELFDGDNFRAVIPVECGPNENIGR
jgi:hypothetical protein